MASTALVSAGSSGDGCNTSKKRLLAKADDTIDTQTYRGRKHAQRRNCDSKLERQLHKHVQEFPTTLLESTVVNGLTAREQARLDCDSLPKGKRLGAKYWYELVKTYTCNTDNVQLLKVKDSTEQVSAVLISALATAQDRNNHKRSVEAFVGWCAHTQSFSQRELSSLIVVAIES